VSTTLYVTPAQVLAAKLAVELSEEAGEEPDEALRAIANAQVITEQESTPAKETGVAEPDQASVEQAVRDVEYIRMFAKVAQAQFQEVLDALNKHVRLLDEFPAAQPSKADRGSEIAS
jgi:hypothetical protein